LIPSVANLPRFCHTAMGTIFETVVAGCEDDYARQASQAFFSEIDRIEGLLSRFDACSEIGQINLLKASQSLRVSAEVYECLEMAFELHSATQGAFDINFRAQSAFQAKSTAARGRKKQNPVFPPLKLLLFESGFEVTLETEAGQNQLSRLDLDLGGIGKGYALEKAAGLFSDWSIENILIHAGTSTVCSMGSAPRSDKYPKGWPVGIGGNWPCLAGKRFCLENRTLSGSGTEVKGRHIYDPRQDSDASGHLAAWVSHPSAAVADALSTAFLVMDTDEVDVFCSRNPETWALVLIDHDRYEVYNKKWIKELPASGRS
jgi:thiamine biosynthesis lipoprotein